MRLAEVNDVEKQQLQLQIQQLQAMATDQEHQHAAQKTEREREFADILSTLATQQVAMAEMQTKYEKDTLELHTKLETAVSELAESRREEAHLKVRTHAHANIPRLSLV